MRADLKYKDDVIKQLRNELKIKQKELLNKNNYNSKIKSFSTNSKKNTADDNRSKQKESSTNAKHDNETINVSTNVNSTEFKNNKRSITVIGDSIIRDVKPYKMKRMLDKNDRLYIKCFPGADVIDMDDYIKPSIRRDPNIIIYHIGTNSLKSEEAPINIANSIIKQVMGMKTDKNQVFLSSILGRNDHLDGKGKQVNDFLKIKCSNLGIGYIDNGNIIKNHLNKSGIHLNMQGTITLAKSFMEAIKN